MSPATVAVLGASGAVGAGAVRALAGAGPVDLRLGGRRPEPLAALAREVGAAEAAPVDLDDDTALRRFCAGADVVVHTAAPAFAIGDRVARAAAAAGAGYVDVSGDAALHEALSVGEVPSAAVLGAGVVPGLSALLPRHVLAAARAAGVAADRVTVHAGGVEHCSVGVARDMLLSLDAGGPGGGAFGEPLAAWRGGRVVLRALRAEEETTLPWFDGVVARQPFLAAESVRLASSEGLTDLTWHTVHPGPAVRAVMRRLRGTDPDAVVGELRAAARLDLVGRRTFYLMVVEATDREGAGAVAVLRSRDSYAMSGAVAARAARGLLAAGHPLGIGYAADLLDAPGTLADLAATGHATLVTAALDPTTADDPVEEGAL